MAETEVIPIDMPDSNDRDDFARKTTHSIRPLYEDYLLEIPDWQMAYTVIEPF
ncbi:hypothetical protein [Escherichia coli]|uniref:hypothetical protein n=1 Tax=Escherichia coli TaxID=562 RepID=UPI0039753276